MVKRYMTTGNIQKIEQRLDNATSELWNALELFSDMDFTKVTDQEQGSVLSLSSEMERVAIYFENIVSVKNRFEEVRNDLEVIKLANKK